ncbi:MAG: complex I NDUFA9 subunit family protein, partial [Acetobacteraceae bacterium]|nr:complex I NDUFA9 subunit family protein [Acetobacteraceae bacterium]
YTFRELLAWILQETRRHRAMIDIPPGVARLQARIGELVPGKPFTRDQLTMLERDNVVEEGALGLAALGIVPTPVELIVPGYLDRFRPGGGKREEVPV